MVIVEKTSFRGREPCPSFYLFGCLYYTIRASRFTRGGGILRRPLQRKQRKHRTFLTLFLYTILKYLFIKILCFRCSWLINGVIKPFVAAQELHKPAQTVPNSRARRTTPLHLYPESPPKLHPNVQLNATAPRINRKNLSSMKPKETTKTGLLTTSKWQIPLRQWQKPARREPERSAASAKRAETLHQRVPRGVAPGAPLVTFPATGKSPGCRAERLHWRSRGHPPRTNSPRRGAKKKQKPQKGGCKKGEFVR